MIYIQKPRQDLDLCAFSFARYLEKYFTQIYRALNGDAMLVSEISKSILLLKHELFS